MHLKLVTLHKIVHPLAFFLELLLKKFLESECWWIYSGNSPVKEAFLCKWLMAKSEQKTSLVHAAGC